MDLQYSDPRQGLITCDVENESLDFDTTKTVSGSYEAIRASLANGSESQATFGQLAYLVNKSAFPQHSIYRTEEQGRVMLKLGCLIGSTLAIVGPKGIFFDDNPPLSKINDPRDYFAELTTRITHKIGRVGYSDDLTVRFAPYGFKLGPQSQEDFARNDLTVAATGNLEAAKVLAQASQLETPFVGKHFGEKRLPIILIPRLAGGDTSLVGGGIGVEGIWGAVYTSGAMSTFPITSRVSRQKDLENKILVA